MTRRSRFTMAVLAGVSLLAASCGGSDGAGTTEEAATTAPVSAESAAAPVTETAVTEPEATDPPVDETEAVAVTEAVEALTASDTGITEDKIRIAVAIADLAAVRAAGISIPETLTSEHLFERWNAYAKVWNADGGINGREVEFVQMMWDPLNPASFDTLCAQVTVDDEVFMLVNGTGLSAVAQQCVVDAGVPVVYGDVVSKALLNSGLVISLAPPAEVIAAAGVDAWLATTDVAPGAKIGVVANNGPMISSAGKAAAERLKAAGYEPQVIETNSLGGDNAATNEEGAAAVGTFLANGVVHAFLATPFTENTGFWNAAKDKMPYTMLDTSSSMCSAFGLSRSPGDAAGSVCATTYDHSTSEGKGIRPDTEFEAECRAFNDENFTEYYGGPSNSGVPAGQKLTDSDGKVLISDYPPLECTLSNIIHLGLDAAGVNPTRQSFIDAVLNLGEVPMALASDGKGLFAPGKPYAATMVHTIRVAQASVEVKAGPDGTYNGCAAPVNCGIVISDWVAIPED